MPISHKSQFEKQEALLEKVKKFYYGDFTYKFNKPLLLTSNIITVAKSPDL